LGKEQPVQSKFARTSRETYVGTQCTVDWL